MSTAIRPMIGFPKIGMMHTWYKRMDGLRFVFETLSFTKRCHIRNAVTVNEKYEIGGFGLVVRVAGTTPAGSRHALSTCLKGSA